MNKMKETAKRHILPMLLAATIGAMGHNALDTGMVTVEYSAPQAQVVCVNGVPVCASSQPSTPAPAATRTPQPSPTRMPTQVASPTATERATAVPITPIPAPIQCGYPGADSSGKGQQYTYTDPQRSGFRQNVRSGPTVGYSIVAYIAKGSTVPVYWHVKAGGYDWYSLDPSCTQWAAMLGVLTDIP